MSGSKRRPNPPILKELHAGYVTQAQLEESAQRISQSLHQQLAAFTNELLSRFPPQQPAQSAAPPPSGGQPSAAHFPEEAQYLASPPPQHAAPARQLRDHVEHVSLPPPRSNPDNSALANLSFEKLPSTRIPDATSWLPIRKDPTQSLKSCA